MTEFRMGGLISGTDVQGIIDKMMVMRGWRMQKMEEEKVECQADVAAWGDISASMTELTMALDKLRSFNTWRNMSCISSDPSKITATASTSAAEAVYTIEILQLAQSHSVGSGRADTLAPSANATTDLVAAGVLNEGDQFVIEGQTITIGASESLSSLRVKINNAAVNMPAATSVTATIMDDRLILMRTNTGSSDISIADVTGSALQTLGVLSAPGVFANELQQASDAIFTVNGVQITRSQNTNITDVIENVTLNLQEETVLPVKLTIRNDRETPKEAILDLVEKYNAAAEKLIEYGKISVSGDNNDGSLVAETGELWNDSLVKSILSNMRRLVTDSKYPNLNVVNSSYTYKGRDGVATSLQDMGIWTEGRDNRLSVVDEEKLDHMLENYFDKSEQLFRGVFDDEVGYTHGVATDFYRYSDNVSATLTGEIARRTERLDGKITDLNKQMADLERSLKEQEQRLWEQFTAMENSVAKMQKELSWLTSQLGIGSSK